MNLPPMSAEDALEIVRLRELALNARTTIDAFENESGPIWTIVKRAREKAATALQALCDVDPNDAKMVQLLQNQVQVYDEIASTIKEIILIGQEADNDLAAEEHEEIRTILGNKPEFEDA